MAAGVVGALALVFLYSNARLVPADAWRQSQFIRTYDPKLGLEHFGHIRESSVGAESAAGRHGVWNSRDIRVSIAVDGSRLPDLLNAMQRNVRDTLTRTGSRFAGGSSSLANAQIDQATYRSRYEESNATGVIRVGPAYRDVSRADTGSAFIVPVWIEEQWSPN